jgi:hypothetical protein
MDFSNPLALRIVDSMKPKVIIGTFIIHREETVGQQQSKVLFSEILLIKRCKLLFFALQEAQ